MLNESWKWYHWEFYHYSDSDLCPFFWGGYRESTISWRWSTMKFGSPSFQSNPSGPRSSPWKGQECQSAVLFDFAFLGYTLFQTSPWFSYVFFINISCLLPLSFDLEFSVQMVAQRWLPKLPKKLVARFKTTAALVFVRRLCSKWVFQATCWGNMGVS